MLKKLSILFLSVVVLFSSVSLAASQSSIIVDKLSAKITTMFDWDKQKQLDLWTVVIKKLDKVAERNSLTEKQKKLYLSIKEEMENRQVEIFKEMFEEKIDKMYEEQEKTANLDWIEWIDWLCNVDMNEIKDLWNWFFWYKNYVLVVWRDLTHLSVIYTIEKGGWDWYITNGWDKPTYIDSNSFEVVEVFWEDYETITDWFTYIDKQYHIKDKNGESYVWYSSCGECAGMGWIQAFTVNTYTKSQPNTVPNYCSDY